MRKIISIANQKGGVGKTTTALNIAAGLVKSGKRVLCIDLDPQGNLSEYLGYERSGEMTINELLQYAAAKMPFSAEKAILKNSEGIDYIPADITLSSADLFLTNVFCREQILKKVLSHEIFQEYDYIIIDCLPSLGVLLSNALTASTSVIIPVQTQKFAYDGLEALLNVCEMVKENVNSELKIKGILLTMTDNTGISKEIERSLREEFGNMVFESKINRSIEAVKSTVAQESLISRNNSKLGAQYGKIVEEILKE